MSFGGGCCRSSSGGACEGCLGLRLEFMQLYRRRPTRLVHCTFVAFSYAFVRLLQAVALYRTIAFTAQCTAWPQTGRTMTATSYQHTSDVAHDVASRVAHWRPKSTLRRAPHWHALSMHNVCPCRSSHAPNAARGNGQRRGVGAEGACSRPPRRRAAALPRTPCWRCRRRCLALRTNRCTRHSRGCRRVLECEYAP